MAATEAQLIAYGTGVQANGDSAYLTLVSGIDCVADDLITRLGTAYLFYDLSFGFDVEGMLNKANQGNFSADFAIIRSQVLQDDRVSNCSVDGSFDGTTLTVNINVTLNLGETFTLVGVASTLPDSTFTFTRGITG